MNSPDHPAGPTPTTRPADECAELRANLHRFALGLTRNAHDADDLTQRTMERILNVQQPITDHRALAVRIATRLWLDHQRGLRRPHPRRPGDR